MVDDPDKTAPGVSPAAEKRITLDQALLAPLDAIFTAQLHAARSFLNMLLQLGYPHDKQDGEPYPLQFTHQVEQGGVIKRQKITVPALSLVPVAPLAVQSATFRLELAVRGVSKRMQLRHSAADDQRKRSDIRPWYLVDEPINIEGVFAAPAKDSGQRGSESQESTVQIEVKIGTIPSPAGLEKLLTALTQTSRLEDVPPAAAGEPGNSPGPGQPGGGGAGATTPTTLDPNKPPPGLPPHS